MRPLFLLISAAIALSSSGALACDEHPAGTEPAKATLTRPTVWLEGDVREVDPDDGSLTMGHGKIARWRMEAMNSMVFKARDPALLANVKPGDKVKFRAAMLGHQPLVTDITPADN